MLDGHLAEWLNLGFRWLHVVAGAAWIGTSFYFNFLNNALRPPPEPRDGVAGELWAIHGGGFYHVEKFGVAPARLPDKLHWFKWEAYTTWITGFGLLFIVYYLGADGLLVDPTVSNLSRGAAVAVGIGTLVLGWLVYDALCRTPLIRNAVAFSVVGWGLVIVAAFALTRLLGGRGGYIHVGALLGTLMAGNVFRVIIPNQRDMVKAMMAGRAPDAAKGAFAALRSLHNNYMTLPVIFIMISNHFPTTYGGAANWLILAGITVAGVMIRHWFNLRGRGKANEVLLPAAAVLLVGLAFVTMPGRTVVVADEPVTEARAFEIIQLRCHACHAATPTQPGFAAPPKGVTFDTIEQVRARLADIERVAVETEFMPLGNITGMTEEERAELARWIQDGAP